MSSYDKSRGGAARAIANHFDTRNMIFWGLCIIFGARRAHASLLGAPWSLADRVLYTHHFSTLCAGKFEGFEQCYPTIRVLLQCGHMSVVFAPYGQLCHAVAMGTGPEPRCVVLLHVRSVSLYLTRHKLTHTGEKPFSCEHPGCGARFTQSNDLKKHERTQHKTEEPNQGAACTAHPPHPLGVVLPSAAAGGEGLRAGRLLLHLERLSGYGVVLDVAAVRALDFDKRRDDGAQPEEFTLRCGRVHGLQGRQSILNPFWWHGTKRDAGMGFEQRGAVRP